VWTFHSAIYNEDLCPTFKNSHRASGLRDNLTTISYCKVISDNRKALERWARDYPGSFMRCSRCTLPLPSVVASGGVMATKRKIGR
jgi:hypothetical protein